MFAILRKRAGRGAHGLTGAAGLALALAAMFAPGAAQAHPHIFIRTGLSLVLGEDGRPAGIEVSWEYDELYSLLVLEDMELDDDYDGKLKPEEAARLEGFDLEWIEGYEGDLYLTGPRGAVKLGPPQGRGTTLSDGKIISRHYRAIEGAGAGPWVMQAYDPTYYTAYDLGEIAMPEGCAFDIERIDLTAAQMALQEELAKIPPEVTETEFPEVGADFADKVRITCGG